MATIIKDSSLFGYTPVEDSFILEKLPELSGIAVKVYLYALMLAHKSIGTADELPLALSLTDKEVESAYSELEKAGALRIISSENGSFAVQLIRLSGGEAALSAAEARRYSALLEKLRAVLGTRNLSGAELKKIYDWIEIFRFDEDAAVEIVRHCIEVKGARVHINYMDAVAKRLAADGLHTLDDLRMNFERESKLMSGAAAVLKCFGISKKPAESQLALYEKWTREWGIGADTVLYIASTETASSNNPNFEYLDSILSRYRDDGGISDESIRELSRERDMIEDIMREALKRAGIKTVTVPIRDKFRLWVHEYRIEREVLLYAAELACSKNKPFAYMNKLITDWHERGIASFQAAKEDAEKHRAEAALPENSAKGKKVNRALGYKQRRYTTDQLKALGIDFGEDVYNSDED